MNGETIQEARDRVLAQAEQFTQEMEQDRVDCCEECVLEAEYETLKERLDEAEAALVQAEAREALLECKLNRVLAYLDANYEAAARRRLDDIATLSAQPPMTEAEEAKEALDRR